MSAITSGPAKALNFFADHGGMLRTSEAIRLGIHPRTLYELRDAAEIEKLAAACTDSQLRRPSQIPIWYQSPFGFHAPRSASFLCLRTTD